MADYRIRRLTYGKGWGVYTIDGTLVETFPHQAEAMAWAGKQADSEPTPEDVLRKLGRIEIAIYVLTITVLAVFFFSIVIANELVHKVVT